MEALSNPSEAQHYMPIPNIDEGLGAESRLCGSTLIQLTAQGQGLCFAVHGSR